MTPPYEITPAIIKLIASISEKLGEVSATFLDKPNPQLRKQNRIRTIHSSLQIEGNTLTEQQVTSIIENKRVVGPEKDIREVMNAIGLYDTLRNYKPQSEKDFLHAHQVLMKGLLPDAGKYRQKGVGIVKGSQVQHLAPPPSQVPLLMKELFGYLKDKKELNLIQSCVFHYEMEFIHPFIDGNGRMGRLWQTLILMQDYPVFEYLPFETLISKDQERYYTALATSDKQGKSTVFIEYMLGVIDQSLSALTGNRGKRLKDTERLSYFLDLGKAEFTRKEYLQVFKELSTATASRDLAKGVASGILQKHGDKKNTIYRAVRPLH